jgi:FMN phosphatase YigB (HAD superfamily)
MTPLYIFDLDGTLADLTHRRHFVERPEGEKDWDAFHAGCWGDAPITPTIVTLVTLASAGVDIRIWSGRMNTVREQTLDWLYRCVDSHTSHYYGRKGLNALLRMRPEGDYTPDDELKEGWLNGLSATDRQRLVAVFEDRARVVAMWRRNGVQCYQVAPGEF